MSATGGARFWKQDKSAVEIRAEYYEAVLRNIACGYWNVGRDKDITVRQYAAQALREAKSPTSESRHP